MSAADTGGVVVWGEAGAGKSTIAREALSAALARGCEVRWVVGTSAARTLPLGAFTAWTQPGVADTVALLRGVINALTTAPPDVPVVVAVDDAHLLDDLSIFVVHQIVQRGAATVILTVVEGEPIPRAVQEIWQAGRFERLELQPLSPAQVAELLAATLSGPVDQDVSQRLWKLTRGNVMYLRNIVEQEVTDGRLAEVHGCWKWSGDPVMAPSLIELVEARIGVLSGAVGDVIDILAVAEPISLAVLRQITDPSAIEEADIRGLITLDPAADGVEVRVAHELYGEVRRKRAAPTRLRRLRGLVADELAVSDDRDDLRVIVRRGRLSLDSDLTPDADLLERAAQGAVWLADLSLADRLADAAVRAGAGPESSFVRAHALSWLGRGEDADAIFAGIRIRDLTDGERARFAFLRASNLLWALADPARAKAAIDAAAHDATPDARTYIDAFLTVYWFAMDQPEAAMRAAQGLLPEKLPPVVGAEIAWVLAAIAADSGRTAEAIGIAEAGYTTATASFDAPHMRFNIADAHVSALVLSGRIDDAHALVYRVRQQAADLPGAAQLLGDAVAGRAALAAGQLDSACALLQRAVVGLSASGYGVGWGYRYKVASITALAMRGAIDEAAAELGTLDAVRRTFRSLDVELSMARAWVSAGQGAVTEAIGIVASAAQRAGAAGQFAAEVMCLQTAAQLGARTAMTRLCELQSVVEGPRVNVAVRFADALGDRNADELASLSEEFERLGDRVAAVDAAAHAALAYRSHGKRGSALVCSARATALAEQGGGVCTPALLQSSTPVPLSDREREIVMLIGGGLSNREVAQRLTLSVRTVESHIYRAMAKTGTSSRDELAALLPHRGTAK